MVQKMKNTSHTTKIVLSTIASIVIAWIGAWQTVQASNGNSNPPLSPQEQSQVRTLIRSESPISSTDRAVLYQSLRDINAKLSTIQVTTAGDHVLIQHIANRR